MPIVKARQSQLTKTIYADPHGTKLNRGKSVMRVKNDTKVCVRWFVPAGPFHPTNPHEEYIPAGKLSSSQRAGKDRGIWEYKLTAAGSNCPQVRKKSRQPRLILSDPVIIIDDN